MISASDFLTRSGVLYDSMRKRFQPRYWKSGKRAGRIREAGRELPFTKDEFRSWLMSDIGYQAKPCGYCGAPIDVLSCCIDHAIPVSRGGSLGLDNLQTICEGCNRAKGSLRGDEFALLKQALGMMHPDAARDVIGRLKTGSGFMRLRFYGQKKAAPAEEAF